MTDLPSAFHSASEPTSDDGPSLGRAGSDRHRDPPGRSPGRSPDDRSTPQRIEDELARRVFRVATPLYAAIVTLYVPLLAWNHAWAALALVAVQYLPIAWALRLAARRRHRAALVFAMWPAWIVNAALVAAEGGLGSPSAWWLVAPVAVLLQAGALRSGATMFALSLAELAACALLRAAGRMPVLFAAPPLGALQTVLAVAGSTGAVVATVWMGVRWRRELLVEVDALRASAEEATRVKSRFIANISHEIRTPLNGIVGAAELLRLAPLDRGQTQAAQIIDHSAHALLAVVNDVLDFAKLEAGRVELERIALDPAALAYDTAETFAGQAQARGVDLWAHAAADVPARIHSDPVRLRQVLHNFVSNAMKFTESGEIRIAVDMVPDDAQAPAQLRFAVRDTGIGLDVAQQTRLFQAFTQADVSTTRRFGGTGLGLVICRELTELLGGRLELESTPGVGSTFSLLLPLPALAASATDADDAFGDEPFDDAVPADDTPGRPVVFICAANAALRDDLGDWAARAGNAAEATATGTPDDWIARARRAGADVVVMDDEALRKGGLARAAWSARLQQAGLAGVLLMGVAVPVAAVPAGLAPLYKPTRPQRLDAALREARRLRARAEATRPAADAFGAAPLPRATPASVSAPAPVPTRAHVLLVEDNAVNQAVATALLAQLGVACDVAPDGSVALEMLDRGADAYACVLMDCQMPVLDGFAATRTWRAREAAAGRPRLPIIAMTANSVAEAGAACEAAGMDDFVAKPFAMAQLATVLARWITSKT